MKFLTKHVRAITLLISIVSIWLTSLIVMKAFGINSENADYSLTVVLTFALLYFRNSFFKKRN